MSLKGSRSMRRYKIEIEAKSAVGLAEMLTKLAAHVMRNGAVTPIRIMDDKGGIIASLEVEHEPSQADVAPGAKGREA